LSDQLALLVEPVPAHDDLQAGWRGRSGEHAVLPVLQRRGGAPQGAVQFAGDAVGGGVVAEQSDQPGHNRGDRGERQREPGAQVHGLRGLSPTPRTVWISSGAPAAVSLRRR
jgi:hypothetical protein